MVAKLIHQVATKHGKSQKEIEAVQEQMQWTVIDGVVYDITNYVDMHPGGKKKILRGVGKDSSEMFHKYHPGLRIERTPLALLKLGELFPDSRKPEV